MNLYANPATIYFIVTLTELSLSCKPVDSSYWVKKLQKQKSDVHGLDIELSFGCGKYFAFLRLSRGHRGILEVIIWNPFDCQTFSWKVKIASLFAGCYIYIIHTEE